MSKEEEWLKNLKETVDKVSEQFKDDLYIGPVGNEGLYQIGKGCYTGKEGYEQFIKALDEDLKNKT
jgi:hypothetical protein